MTGRRILSVVLAVAIIIGAAPLGAYAATGDEEFEIQNGVLIRYNGTGGSVVIPNGVTAIGEQAFHGCTALTSVTIPNGVTRIGRGAFESCTGLTSVTIPDSVTAIEDYAFYCCEALKSVTLPKGITVIGENMFAVCRDLKSITIPDGVKSIGNDAFYACAALTNITIPTSVTMIYGNPFISCQLMTAINVAAGNTKYKSIDGILYNKAGTELIACPTGKGGDVTIPKGVTTIDSSAFWGCDRIWSITIPDGVTAIGVAAFAYCYQLASVTIPNSVKTIGENAFGYCNLLTDINVAEGNANYKSIDGILYNKSVTKLIQCPSGKSDAVIPSSVTAIGNYAFVHCINIKSVKIPKNVTAIGDYAFLNCVVLTSITIPKSVTTIGESAFVSCSALTSVTIPDSVTAIGNYAFLGCAPGFTIAAYIGSVAETYAKENEIKFNLPEPQKVTAKPAPATVYVNGVAKTFECYEIGGQTYFKLTDAGTALKDTINRFSVGKITVGGVSVRNLTSGANYNETVSKFDTKASKNQTATEILNPIYVNGKKSAVSGYLIKGSSYYLITDLQKYLGFAVSRDASKKTKDQPNGPIAITAVKTSEAALKGPASVKVNGVIKKFETYQIGGETYFKLIDVGTALKDTESRFAIDTTFPIGGGKTTLNLLPGQKYNKTVTKLDTAAAKDQKRVPVTTTIYVGGKPSAINGYFVGSSSYYKIKDLGGALGFSVTRSTTEKDERGNGMILITTK